MRKKILAIIFAVVLVASMAFSSSASYLNIRKYRDSYDEDESIRVRASLQGMANQDDYYFTRLIATLMFTESPDATMPPQYTALNLTINAQASSVGIQSFTTSDTMYINTDILELKELFDAEEHITQLSAQYIAQALGSAIQINPDSMSMVPSDSHELPSS